MMVQSQQMQTHERNVRQLPDSALVLLSLAASREDRMVLPLPSSVRVRGSAKDKLLRKLLRMELIEDVPVAGTGEAWWTREDSSRVGLRITAKGMDAIGVAENHADSDSEAAAAEQTEIGSVPATDREASSVSMQSARADGDHKTEKGLGADSFAEFQARPGSKQALLMDRLSSGTGSTLDELSKLLGWQRHTVRAALTGLRRKGIRVTKSKSADGATLYRAVAWPGNR